jgi:hypothetical protein
MLSLPLSLTYLYSSTWYFVRSASVLESFEFTGWILHQDPYHCQCNTLQCHIRIWNISARLWYQGFECRVCTSPVSAGM